LLQHYSHIRYVTQKCFISTGYG